MKQIVVADVLVSEVKVWRTQQVHHQTLHGCVDAGLRGSHHYRLREVDLNKSGDLSVAQLWSIHSKQASASLQSE